MPSQNKTSLGLNQWEATDELERVDFNKDNEIINEQFAKKVSGKLIVYTSMEELGIRNQEETFDKIHSAMADYSMLIYGAPSTISSEIYVSHGVLEVVRFSSARVAWRFTTWRGEMYIGGTLKYPDDSTARWSGWKKVLTE